MHNLALALSREGYVVSGSDDEIAEPSRSRLLREGILPEQEGWFPDKIQQNLDLVILGMHARSNNPELIRAIELAIPVFSYPEYLYERSKNKTRVVIGGSHGKTTITSMILHVLNYCKIETDYMVGAQLEGFDIMVRLSETAKWMVFEGDEYLTSPLDPKPKFLHYHPDIALISGIGWDHMNVFPTFDSYLQQFRLFVDSISPGGQLIWFGEDQFLKDIAKSAHCKSTSYFVHPHETSDEKTFLLRPDKEPVMMQVFGSHNMANLSAALQVCLSMGVDEDAFYEAISSFKGASRRLEMVWKHNGSSAYRDFAHAPSKVKASVKALHEQFPDKNLIACLELHTYSSLSKSFLNQYEETLSDANAAIVFYDPHAVELKKLPPLDFDFIRLSFNHSNLKVFSDIFQLDQYLKSIFVSNSIVVFMSSGNFAGYDFSNLKSDI